MSWSAVGNNVIWESLPKDVTRWTASYPGGALRAAAFGNDTFVVVGAVGVIFTKQVAAPQIHAISQVPANYSISPLSRSFAYPGGSGSVTVSASAEAYWTAFSNQSWISVTSGSNGTGSGSVNYTR